MSHDPIVEEIYHHAYAETLFNKARELLCPNCSKLLENEAIERYRRKMAKRREEIASLQAKAQEERHQDARRRKLDAENRRNNPLKRTHREN